jgi:hypothetical protein
LDSRLLAYGVEVDELLSMNNTETWTNELWTMFSGYMLAQKELGYSPNISKIFFTFRDLLLFFENVEMIRNRN